MMKNNKIHFYGLLHVAPRESTSLVLKNKRFDKQISIYLKNAEHLAASFRAQGLSYTLLTNDRSYIEGLLNQEGLTLNLVEIKFTREVPSGARFYSAHYKIDVFKYFQQQIGEYSVLCDLDMVCLQKLPEAFKRVVAQEKPIVYNITSQVTADYGGDVVCQDLSKILKEDVGVTWYGGELIGGSASFFSTLNKEIDKRYGDYIEVIEDLNHVGDESIVSASLNALQNNNYTLVDAGELRLVGRYWNAARFLTFQRPIEYYSGCFLMHLPVDKEFLSRCKFKDSGSFLKSYKNYRYFSFSGIKRMMKTFAIRLFRLKIKRKKIGDTEG